MKKAKPSPRRKRKAKPASGPNENKKPSPPRQPEVRRALPVLPAEPAAATPNDKKKRPPGQQPEVRVALPVLPVEPVTSVAESAMRILALNRKDEDVARALFGKMAANPRSGRTECSIIRYVVLPVRRTAGFPPPIRGKRRSSI